MKKHSIRIRQLIVLVALIALCTSSYTVAALPERDDDYNIHYISFSNNSPKMNDTIIVTCEVEYIFDTFQATQDSYFDLRISGACNTVNPGWDCSYRWPAWCVAQFSQPISCTMPGTITAHLRVCDRNGQSHSPYEVEMTRTVVVAAPPAPTISFFSASPGTIDPGKNSTLSWSISGATSASINNGVGSAAVPTGTFVVTPSSTTTYMLTAQNGQYSFSYKNVTVTINNPKSSVTLSADKTSITAGDYVTLSWTSKNATAVSIDNGVGSVTPVTSGSKKVYPTTTTTYTATATSSHGDSSKSNSVTVTVTPHTPTVIFTADPTAVKSGTKSTLSWTVHYADISITLDGASISDSGSKDVYPTTTTTYNLIAVGAGGTTEGHPTVTVSSGAIVNLGILPSSVNAGDSATLSWDCANINSLSITDNHSHTLDIGGKSLTHDSIQVSPTQDTRYTALGAGVDSATCNADITVYPGTGPTVTLHLNPTSIDVGDNSTLSWSSTGATAVTIDNGVDTGNAPSGSILVHPTSTTTYTATATASGKTSGTNSITLNVNTPNDGAPTISLTVSKSSIDKETDVRVSWVATNAVNVTIDHGVYSGASLTGGVLHTVNTTTTFVATAKNASGGIATATATVNYTGKQQEQAPTDWIMNNLWIVILIIIIIIFIIVYWNYSKKSKKKQQTGAPVQKNDIVKRFTSLFKKKKQPAYVAPTYRPSYSQPAPAYYQEPQYGYRRRKRSKKVSSKRKKTHGKRK